VSVNGYTLIFFQKSFAENFISLSLHTNSEKRIGLFSSFYNDLVAQLVEHPDFSSGGFGVPVISKIVSSKKTVL
jgi:hypothetical protein